MEQEKISQFIEGMSPDLAQKLQVDGLISLVLRKVKDYDSDNLLNVLNLLITLSESEREEIRRVMQGMEEEERGMPEVLEMTEAGKAEELTESERGILTGADDEGQWMVVDMKSNEIDVAASIVNMNNVLKGKLPVKAASGKRLVRWQEYVDEKKKAQSPAKEEGKRENKKPEKGRSVPEHQRLLREMRDIISALIHEPGRLKLIAFDSLIPEGSINFQAAGRMIVGDMLIYAYQHGGLRYLIDRMEEEAPVLGESDLRNLLNKLS